MTLPALSIPEIPIPLQIPELIHPAIVHFVIAIPVVILLLEIYNLGVKRRSISVFSFLLLLVVTVAMFGAYLTGGIDGQAAVDAGLSSAGKADLKEHKLLGIYLVYASVGLVLFKLLFMAIRKTFGKILFILILGGFIAVTLYQGKEGGELVYKYGANNSAVADLASDMEDVTEERDELQEALDEMKKSATKTVTITPVAVVEPKKEEAKPVVVAPKVEEKQPTTIVVKIKEEEKSLETPKESSTDTNSSNE